MSFKRARSPRPDRIVISGVGCLTPLGNTRERLWDGFRHARSGIQRISAFDPRPFAVQIAGEVRDFDPFGCFPPKDRQHVSRTAGLAIGAARQALDDARLDSESLDIDARRRIAVVLGTGGGGLEFTERQYAFWYHNEPR